MSQHYPAAIYTNDPATCQFGTIAIGFLNQASLESVPKGYSSWLNKGLLTAAPTVPADKYGGHDYAFGGLDKGITKCKCGCTMTLQSASGPVDPFGPCPLNPIKL